LYVGSDLAFSGIKSDAGPVTELFDYIKQDHHVVDGIGDQCAIVRIPFASEAKATRSYVVAFLRGAEPTFKWFDHEVEKQWGEGVPL